MAKRIYVGNLPFSATSQDVEAAFNQYGMVLSARVIIDRDTGRSKGFAFVEMENDDEAVEAIRSIDRSEFEGRQLAVSEARPREERMGGTGRMFYGERPNSFRPQMRGYMRDRTSRF